MNAKIHKELLEKFKSSGGSPRVAQSLKIFSLANYARLKYEYKKLSSCQQESTIQPVSTTVENSPKENEVQRKNKVFNDFISEYPVQLHSTYRKRWEMWLEACSLKVKLNAIDNNPKLEEKAFDLQIKIYRCFKVFDDCQKKLKHYQVYKRIMPTDVQKDFSKMSEVELLKYQNNLRALITRRRQTISKMEAELPNEYSENYTKKLHSLNLKREQLAEKENELIEVESIIKKYEQ